MEMISKVDFVGVPSTDSERSRAFYVGTLGLRPDEHGRFEFWAGDTCFGIWEPAKMGMEFAPQKNAHPPSTSTMSPRRDRSWNRKASSSSATSSTRASATWPSSPTRTATT
jgi:catechol 2,3-dioxygenase-like lactoylglutathione lyase family enzyme